jgi:hypothetical protein
MDDGGPEFDGSRPTNYQVPRAEPVQSQFIGGN